MLGPGTSITHAAITTLADNGCLVLWSGEGAVRFYAGGMGETRSAKKTLHQARLYANPDTRLKVVFRLYNMRFREDLDTTLTLRQVRGKEGIRVRDTYARMSRESGVAWSGRSYKREDWAKADPVNRALSAANSCLYGVCHAATVSAGYSPGIGFIHTGKMLSFVYDVADLYKTEITIPAAFLAAAEGGENIESRVRRTCRDFFQEQHMLQRIIPDVERALDVTSEEIDTKDIDADAALPGGLWDPLEGIIGGGVNFSAGEVTSGRVDA